MCFVLVRMSPQILFFGLVYLRINSQRYGGKRNGKRKHNKKNLGAGRTRVS